jgi:hypothetical protein
MAKMYVFLFSSSTNDSIINKNGLGFFIHVINHVINVHFQRRREWGR